MTWKERQIITILSAILAVLSIVLLIVLGIRYQASRADSGEPGQAEGTLITAEHEYTALSYCNGSATLSFSLDEAGNWIWSDDPDFPLDDTTVTDIIGELSTLKPQQTITNGDTLESYGLDSPTATLTATTARGAVLTLAFGKATTDGDSYYMLMNGDEATVYIVADTLYRRMQTAIYDMMVLPELPDLTEGNILSIIIEGSTGQEGTAGLSTVLTAQHTEGSEDTTWRCNGANVTDDETVQALLDDLAVLSIDQCVDYRPSDEALSICGFDSPAATLTVEYTAGTDTSQTLTLYIGVSAAGGDGRYVRLKDDATIYLLPTASLDPLMRISVNGLEA